MPFMCSAIWPLAVKPACSPMFMLRKCLIFPGENPATARRCGTPICGVVSGFHTKRSALFKWHSYGSWVKRRGKTSPTLASILRHGFQLIAKITSMPLKSWAQTSRNLPPNETNQRFWMTPVGRENEMAEQSSKWRNPADWTCCPSLISIQWITGSLTKHSALKLDQCASNRYISLMYVWRNDDITTPASLSCKNIFLLTAMANVHCMCSEMFKCCITLRICQLWNSFWRKLPKLARWRECAQQTLPFPSFLSPSPFSATGEVKFGDRKSVV